MALKSVEGKAINGYYDHYRTECPKCKNGITWKTFFDSTTAHICPNCHERFYVNKVWINEEECVT